MHVTEVLDDRLMFGLANKKNSTNPLGSLNLYSKMVFVYLHKLTSLLNRFCSKRWAWNMRVGRKKTQRQTKCSWAVLMALGTWEGALSISCLLSPYLTSVLRSPAQMACSVPPPFTSQPYSSFGGWWVNDKDGEARITGFVQPLQWRSNL